MLNGWRAHSWSAFRVLFGGYLAIHFAGLLPAAVEVFSGTGMATAEHSPLFGFLPSPLWLSDSPPMVLALVVSAIGASSALAVGFKDRFAAGWTLYVLACLFAANPLIANPSLPHVGWMLLAHTLIIQPPPLWILLRRPDAAEDWRLPAPVFAVGWAVMALAYGYSGWTKLGSASWIDGTAMRAVLDNPLARPTLLRTMLLDQPWILALATWCALGLELAAPLLALSKRARPALWVGLLVLQLGLLVLVDFADLTWGMLMLQAWTFDPRWLQLERDSEVRLAGAA